MRTLKEMAHDALLVQSASNLSGVIHSWSRLLPDLRARVQEEDPAKFNTTDFNAHPINVMFANKVNQLACGWNDDRFGEAYKWCQEITK